VWIWAIATKQEQPNVSVRKGTGGLAHARMMPRVVPRARRRFLVISKDMDEITVKRGYSFKETVMT
jgi:hypothetical protein